MCEYYDICKNNHSCYRCFNHELLNIKGKRHMTRITNITEPHDYKTSMRDDSWKDLEQQVADKLNNVPTIQDARRSRASGSLWFEKGDVVDAILHPECKERTGKELKTGEKTMTIKKEWLEKASKECEQEGTTMCLPFRFKGDKNIYCIFNNNDIATLITTMKSYMLDNETKDTEIKQLKKLLENYKHE